MISDSESFPYNASASYVGRGDYSVIKRNLSRLISIYECLVMEIAMENLVCLSGGEPKKDLALCAEKLRVLLKEAISATKEYLDGVIDGSKASVRLHAVVEVVENNPCSHLLSQYVSAAAITYLLAEAVGGAATDYNEIAYEAHKLMELIDGAKPPLSICTT